MDRTEQTRYGAMLEAAAAALRRLLAGDHESTQPVVPDRAIGRLSRVDAMQAQQMSLAGRRRQQGRLRRIEHALGLVRQGTYGSCTRCGEDIGQARLDALPDTFLCVKYLRNTALGNILNLCAVCLPCGFTAEGLPIGLMIYAKPFDEAMALRVAWAYEQATEWRGRRPDLNWAR